MQSFKFIMELPANILNLKGTYEQSF